MFTSQSKLLLFPAAFALVHFLATWLFTLQSWTNDSATGVVNVLSYPGTLAIPYLGRENEKLKITALMFANSVPWGVALTIPIVVVRRLWRRAPHQA